MVVGIIGHFAQQTFHIFLQTIDRGPDAQHLLQVLRRQVVALLAPIVLHRLHEQSLLIGHQLFVKQAATVKGMVTQHALAPCVDGVHAGFVHAFSGHRQAPCVFSEVCFVRV